MSVTTKQTKVDSLKWNHYLYIVFKVKLISNWSQGKAINPFHKLKWMITCNKLYLCVLKKVNRNHLHCFHCYIKTTLGFSFRQHFSLAKEILSCIWYRALVWVNCLCHYRFHLYSSCIPFPQQNLLEVSTIELRWPSMLKALTLSIKYIAYFYHHTWDKHSVKGQVAFHYLPGVAGVGGRNWCFCRAKNQLYVLPFTAYDADSP